METGLQPQSQGPPDAGQAEEQARRLLAELDQQSRLRRAELEGGSRRSLLRAIGILVVLLIGLGAVLVLLHSVSALPELIERSR